MGRRAGVRFLLLCLLTATASSLKCTVHPQSNSSVRYQLSEMALPKCEVDWAIDGKNVANEDDVDHSVVIQRTAEYLLLNAYYSNVTYTEGCSTELRKVFCQDAISPGQSDPSHDDSRRTWISISAVVASLGLIVILLVVIWGWKKGWFQKAGEEPGQPSEGVQLTSGEKMV